MSVPSSFCCFSNTADPLIVTKPVNLAFQGVGWGVYAPPTHPDISVLPSLPAKPSHIHTVQQSQQDAISQTIYLALGYQLLEGRLSPDFLDRLLPMAGSALAQAPWQVCPADRQDGYHFRSFIQYMWLLFVWSRCEDRCRLCSVCVLVSVRQWFTVRLSQFLFLPYRVFVLIFYTCCVCTIFCYPSSLMFSCRLLLVEQWWW